MTDELIKNLQPLVAAETARASKQYGEQYASEHEAESVLREQIDETEYESDAMESIMTELTAYLHSNKCLSEEKIDWIRQRAFNAAAAAVQVAAVCEKIARGFEK